MNVVILTWEEYVPDCPADLEVASPTYLGVFEAGDSGGVERAKLDYAKSRVAIDAEDVGYGPVWKEDNQPLDPPERQIPEEPDLDTFLTHYGDTGYFLVWGPIEVGRTYGHPWGANTNAARIGVQSDTAAERGLTNEEGFLIGTYPPIKPPQEETTT